MSTIDDCNQHQENIQLYAPTVPPIPPYRPPNKRGRKQHDTTSADNLIEEAQSTLKSIAQGKRNTSPVSQPKSDDVHFGETMGRLLGGIADSEEKDFLKLQLQEDDFECKVFTFTSQRKFMLSRQCTLSRNATSRAFMPSR